MQSGLQRCAWILLGGVNSLPQTPRDFRQVQRDKDVIPHRIRHPLARCLNPEDAVQLYGAISSARLREERVASDALGEFPQWLKFRVPDRNRMLLHVRFSSS